MGSISFSFVSSSFDQLKIAKFVQVKGKDCNRQHDQRGLFNFVYNMGIV